MELCELAVKQGFWPGAKDGQNGPRQLLCTRLHSGSVDPAMQIRAMREYAVPRGWTIATQVKEVGSGTTQWQLGEKLLKAARRPSE